MLATLLQFAGVAVFVGAVAVISIPAAVALLGVGIFAIGFLLERE